MSNPPAPVPLPILWGAFVSTHALLLVLSFFVPAEPIAQASLVPLLAIPAMIAAGLAAEGSLVARVAPHAQTWCILRFALAESAGILGFVTFLLSGAHLVQLVCAACGLVAHLLAFPSPRALEGYSSLRR
ncbi:MAG: hypothetical protein Q8P18_06250 [Pseudomonadota bacterium]|nr:hypothetical protein [Pseudomonadota bacterium]